MKSIPYKNISSISSFRKLSVGAWSRPSDPTVNIQIDCDITRFNASDNVATGLSKAQIIKLISQVIEDVPDMNRVLIRRKIRQRLVNRIFVPTVFRRKGEIDLSGISIDNAYQLSIHDIEQVMKNKVKAIRSFSDPQISRFIKILDFNGFGL